MVTLLLQAPLLSICAWLSLATLVVATTGPALVHEARQGPLSSDSLDPTSSTSSTDTMSPTPTSESSTASTSSILLTMPTSSKISPLPSSSSLVNLASLSSSVTSATPQPSPSPAAGSLAFTVNNMTTCTSGLISWAYTGQTADLVLSLTNIVVDPDVSLHVKVKQNTLTSTGQQLVDTNASASSWTWPTVNITEGWYKIQGQVLITPTVSNSSVPFFVSNGTNVSCLTATSPQPSSTSSSSLGSKLNVGGLIGGVVVGILGVALVVLIVVWLWMRRRRGLTVGGSRGKNRQWGSLKSNPSSIQPESDGVRVTRDVFHSHSESTGAMFQTASASTTPGGSEEDIDTVGEEKLISPASSPCVSPADVLNTPIRYDRRTSLQSVQTPTTAVSDSSSRSRAFSQCTSNHTLEQQAQRIRSSMETSFRRRSERLSLPSLPPANISLLPYTPTLRQSNREEYPLSSVVPINRSISTGAVTTSMPARRASRKPVPHYDPSVLLEDTNADTLSACAESSYSHGTGTGTGTGVNGASQDLVHKASFGDGRPMHYLIPDLPPPQQDDVD